MKKEKMNTRENLKQFQLYLWFTSLVKKGETAMVFAPGFVVIDWKTWRELNKKREKKYGMFFDEVGEISDEIWGLLEKRLKSSPRGHHHDM